MQGIDVSALDSNTNYDDTEFLNEITAKTTAILSREFPDVRQKRNILKDSNGLVLACPYCRDSMKDMSKKRGHLLLRGKWAGNFKCFNCNTFVSIPKFMSDFDESLTLSGIKYVQEHKQAFDSIINASSNEITADVFSKELAAKYGIERDAFRDMLGLCDVTNNYRSRFAHDYLMSRLQFKFDQFLYDPKRNALVILNMCDKRVIGFQLRLLGKNVPKGKRYLTVNLDRMYKKLLKRPEVEIPEELNTISTLFNIYNINVYKPIIVTEGPLDAFLLPNAIATSGANKNLSVELPFWYLFDADKTGQKHAIEKMKEHKNVFLWGKLKKDLLLPKRDKWDVNDVVLYVREKYGYEYRVDWYKYFSDNVLDMIYLSDMSF